MGTLRYPASGRRLSDFIRVVDDDPDVHHMHVWERMEQRAGVDARASADWRCRWQQHDEQTCR